MDELDDGHYYALPSSSQLAVEILNGSFAWDALTSDKTTYSNGPTAATCARRKTSAGYRSKVKLSRRRNDDDDDDGDDGDEDAGRRPVAHLLHEAIISRDNTPDVLFDINFTVAKVRTSVTVLVLMLMMMMMMMMRN